MMLSDASIRQQMQAGALIPNGNPTRATQAAYHFTAGKIFTGGSDSQCVDWSTGNASGHFVVKPGAMIWVRMLEEVSIPNNICAVWWQTHSLSKKGIMLINMSVVDPGYKGYLTALLVNFGSQHVSISADQPIAKLAFFKIDKNVSNPFSGTFSATAYDADVHQTSVNGPKSFLRIDDIHSALGAEKKKILEEIAAEAPRKIGRAYAWAFLGFALLVGATTLVPWLQSSVKPNLQDAVSDEIDKRVAAQSLVLQPKEKALEDHAKALEARIDALEKSTKPKR